jgi:FkbM family methyltransferase
MGLRSELEKYLETNKKGVYIELGAYDGVTQSNTKWLEDDYNWSGILIEPSTLNYSKCLKNRKNNNIVNCVCVSFDYKKETIKGDFHRNSPMSSVDGIRNKNRKNFTKNLSLQEFKTTTLQKVIDDSKFVDIDFLSLDVEGYELEVLKGVDFKKQKIKYILIEVYNKDKDDIFSYMENNNYSFIKNISNFKKETHPRWDGTHNDYLFKLNE